MIAAPSEFLDQGDETLDKEKRALKSILDTVPEPHLLQTAVRIDLSVPNGASEAQYREALLEFVVDANSARRLACAIDLSKLEAGGYGAIDCLDKVSGA